MAKCKTCGKRGLFLKLQNGLCSACADALFNSQYAFITHEKFQNPPPILPDEPIKRNEEHVPDASVISTDGKRMNKQFLPGIFQWDGIARIDNNFYEITSDENIQTAIDEILKLNILLNEAAGICDTIPNSRFKKTQLRFKFDPKASIRNYCMLSFNPMTSTGKLPKAMVNLHVVQGKNMHGEIKFDNKGAICRAEISIITTKKTYDPDPMNPDILMKQDATSHKIVLAMQGNELKVRFIYRNTNGINTKVFDSKAA